MIINYEDMRMKLHKYFLILPLISLFIFGCSSEDKTDGDAAHSASKDAALREYNIDVKKEQTKNRFPCDTIALQEYVLGNYPAGSYILERDRMGINDVPKPIVVYFNDGGNFILTLIAKSKSGERNVEIKNLSGYESSFINLDSTKLGTAFLWLTLFEVVNENFNMVWESEVPIHGGFNTITLKTWKPKNIKYVEVNFEDGIISGHRNYNFFMIDRWRKPPHLMETYVGIVHKRNMANVNNDKFPDYFEYRFAEDSSKIRVVDSIPFYWSEKRKLYITNRSPRWFRQY
jgi:hypothetical protein